jgi:amino acid adenylation domain-containing protein
MTTRLPPGPLLGNFARALLETAASLPTKTALIESESTSAYGELAARSRAIADALADYGVRPDDRVAIFLPRGVDAAASFFGALATGAIAVTVNETLRPRQIEHILNHSGARVLLTMPAMIDRLARRLHTRASVVSLAEIPALGTGEPVPRVGTDIAHIVYTSGSTGLPKGVAISHGNLWAGMQAVVGYLGITERDRILSLLPFSFDYGLNQLLCCAGTGATLVVESSPVPQRIVRTLRAHEVTVLPAVPPLWLQLLNVQAFTAEPIRSLRVMTNTGGRLPTEAVRTLGDCQPHASLFLMYGLTEAFRSTYLPPSRTARKPNSIGRAIPGAEVLVLDEQHAPCKPGEVGELVHRGPTVALGYWNDPEATAQVFRPHPLRPPGAPDTERIVFSGDLVYRDEEGDLFVVGRRDAMIKTLGYRVSPDEVVEALYASGEVVEAIVTAEPDEVRGSRIVAYVVLRDDADLARLQAFSAQELPRYMQPSRFETRPSLRRTPSGKHDAIATTGDSHDPD